MKKRILSMLLVLVLMATLVPLHADAAVTIYWPVPGHTHLSKDTMRTMRLISAMAALTVQR